MTSFGVLEGGGEGGERAEGWSGAQMRMEAYKPTSLQAYKPTSAPLGAVLPVGGGEQRVLPRGKGAERADGDGGIETAADA